jgi:hypothetical protein
MFMKILLLLLLLVSQILCYSQSQKAIRETVDVFSKVRNELIEFKTQSQPQTSLLSFSGIKVLDKRYDTSAIGYMRIVNPHSETYRLITKNKLQYDANAFLNQLYKKGFRANDSLLIIVVRKFWLYKKYTIEDPKLLKGNIVQRYLFNLSIDCFSFAKNVYTHLIRKDTIIIMKDGAKESEKGTLISESVGNVVNSLSLDSVARQVSGRKKFTYTELNEYYDQNLRQPILNDTFLRKGVYRTFEEFKQNRPYYTNFEVTKVKPETILYLTDDKGSVPTTSEWGYCDGKNIYIKTDKHLFKLNRLAGSFLFMGDKKMANVAKGPNKNVFNNIPGLWIAGEALDVAMSTPDKLKYELVPLQLDMASGELY